MGERTLIAFVRKDQDVFCLDLAPWPKNARLVYHPFYETSPGLKPLGHPEVELLERDGLAVAVQRVLPDKVFALAWNREGPEIIVSVGVADAPERAVGRAIDMRGNDGVASHSLAHQAGWKAFWGKSDIALTEPRFEYLWRFGLYLLASSAKSGEIPPGLQGLWAMNGRTPPWNGSYYADMNVEQYFSPATISGHSDLLDCWLNNYLRIMPKIKELTRAIFGTEGAFSFAVFQPDYTLVSGGHWDPVNFGWSNTGWLTMFAWERWRYSMDNVWLEQVGYPLVEAAFVFYAANLAEGEDGKLHVPLSDSPEYEGGSRNAWCRDPNIDLALIRKCCDWIVEMESALGIARHTVESWRHQAEIGWLPPG